MTRAEVAYRRIEAAQRDGQIGQKFRMEDVLRAYPEYRLKQSSLLSDHARGNPQGRRIWFIQKEPGLYILDPAARP